jgi:hypothetical protein
MPTCRVIVALAFAGACVAAIARICSRDTPTSHAPIYPVGVLETQLQRDPAAWLQRSVHVRAVVGVCVAWTGLPGSARCADWEPWLADPGRVHGSYLRLLASSTPPLKALLRRLGVLSGGNSLESGWSISSAGPRVEGTWAVLHACSVTHRSATRKDNVMKTLLHLRIAVPGLLGATCLAIAATQGHTSQGPVYAARTVRDGLTHDPSAWVGRTILVRGRVGGCIPELDAVAWPCHSHTDRQPPQTDTLEALPLVVDDADTMLSVARRIPVLSGMLPSLPVLHWESAATYRVRIRAGAFPFCGTGTCYEAQLLDASPGFLPGS